jgi:hypothetical protein
MVCISIRCPPPPVVLYFSGLHTPGLLHSDGRSLRLAALLPQGTHNAQVLDEGILYNDTASDRVCYRRGAAAVELPVPEFPARPNSATSNASPRLWRGQGSRAACAYVGEGLVAGGSSPSTISLYDVIARDARSGFEPIHGRAQCHPRPGGLAFVVDLLP